ncbi:hypothetical protein D8674_033504 [Pyrus ussuriensis x Pyrus communis]|uniref:Uncharacterized protein n=1 Tax=Pyrus ussuriensis x Pyrus communis TaxID=2448454 RepID=A0A5N5HLA6_9ROSA|nr:hypothetical protein D8674_033504 [Pyrus ussuriensis x Pyrus communis]
MDSGGSGVMRLEGSNSTNNQVVNPIVIQSDAYAVKSFRLRQEGQPVGVYYADLKSVWQELDQRRPIQMVCAVDLKTLREEIQIDRVYAFFAGLDDVFDKVNNQGGLPSMAMISRPAGTNRSSNSSNQSLNSRPFNRENKDDLKCNFCGQTRHTEDTCFTKHGVPDWFPELKKKLRAKERGAAGSSGGRASLAAATPTVQEAVPSLSNSGQNLLTRTQGALSSDTGTMGHVFLASEKQHHTGWILDSGATDHMTYDKNMFQYMTTSHRKNISTANGTLAPVCGAGTVHLTPSLPLHHYLLVPSLSHHLLSIPQVTEQLDCVVLMYPSFCLLQDIQTNEIIGRGTKREGLYYVDDVVSGRANAIRVSRSSILHKTTCPYTPQQNGVAERKNRHILETARALLLGASVPKFFWPEAVTYAGESSSDDLKWLDLEGIPVVDAVHNGAVIIHAENDKSAIVAESSMQSGPVPEESDPETNGSIDRYKARLVAKGYTQTYGVDYQETFSPVAKMNTVRVMISLAANMNWPLKQFDVKNAFLHGNLEEEVYMDFPPGYSAGRSTGVCRLRKSLYGLKQSPRAWFDRFTQVMKNIGYYQSHSDHTLFVKRRQEKVTALIIYVDDMIITGDDCDEISRLQRNLAAEFEMKNLGDLKYFLGVEVARSSKGIFLSQRKYVLDLLKETGMLGCKPVDTPIVEKHHLCLDPNQKSVDKGRYQRLVGRLIYLAHTRPDIAYAVSVVSQFMHSSREDHMAAVMRILAYLKSAPGKGVLYRKHGHLRIEGFTDADWAGSVGDRRSTSGYFTFVGGNLVTWRSKKQKVVSRSSAEAEFRGMAHGICELLWLRKLLEGLGFKPKETMRLYCDNKSARDIADNPVQHDRTKHVKVDRHFIKEKLERKIVSILFVSSDEQLADVLTHAVCSREFDDSLVKLGMCDIYAPT